MLALVWPPICISTILQSGKFLNLAHYCPYDVKLRLLAHSRSFLANQKARNAIAGAENLLRYSVGYEYDFSPQSICAPFALSLSTVRLRGVPV